MVRPQKEAAALPPTEEPRADPPPVHRHRPRRPTAHGCFLRSTTQQAHLPCHSCAAHQPARPSAVRLTPPRCLPPPLPPPPLLPLSLPPPLRLPPTHPPRQNPRSSLASTSTLQRVVGALSKERGIGLPEICAGWEE
jgi:hypothetical protein